MLVILGVVVYDSSRWRLRYPMAAGHAEREYDAPERRVAMPRLYRQATMRNRRQSIQSNYPSETNRSNRISAVPAACEPQPCRARVNVNVNVQNATSERRVAITNAFPPLPRGQITSRECCSGSRWWRASRRCAGKRPGRPAPVTRRCPAPRCRTRPSAGSRGRRSGR